MMRLSEAPLVRITVHSLAEASWLKAARQPMSTASGSRVYMCPNRRMPTYRIRVSTV